MGTMRHVTPMGVIWGPNGRVTRYKCGVIRVMYGVGWSQVERHLGFGTCDAYRRSLYVPMVHTCPLQYTYTILRVVYNVYTVSKILPR
jgi:hypothetical protein